jgi:hypothetical protein
MTEPAAQPANPSSGEVVNATSRWRRLATFCVGILVLAYVTMGAFRELVMRPDGLLVGVHADGHNDLTLQFLRFRDTPAELTRQGGDFRSANWDPHLGLGMPVHGNPQMALFYPPNWLCFSFGAARTVSWLLVAHMFFAGLGTWVLARSAGLSSISSLLAGSIAIAAPYCVAHLAEGHFAQISAVAWVPWILFSCERFLASDGRHWKAVAVCLMMSFLAGHVQEPYYLSILLSGTVVISALTRMKKGEPGAFSLLAHWAVAGVVALAVVSIDIIPVYLNSLGTGRAARLPLEEAGAGLQFENLRQLVNPFALGRPGETGTAVNSFYWTRLFYFGIAPLLLAILGALVSFRRPFSRRILLITLVGLVFAMGTLPPLYELCYQFVPMIGSFRIPARILFIVSYGVGILAAVGLEALIVKTPREDSSEPSTAEGTASARPGISPVGWLIGIVALAVSVEEIGWHARSVVEVAKPEALRTDSEVSRFLKQNIGHHRVQTTDVLYSDLEALRDDVQRVRGYEPVVQIRLAWMLDALSAGPDDRLDFAGFQETRIQDLNGNVADLVGLKFVITSLRQDVPDDWRLVKTGKVSPWIHLPGSPAKPENFGIYENLDVMPRAFVVGEVVEIAGVAPQAAIEGLEQLDARSAVMLDRDVLPEGERASFQPAEIVEALSDRVTIRVSNSEPGYLVLTDLFHPGWSATVDGEKTKVLPANLSFRAVPLPAGAHEVVFRYECPGQRIGMILGGSMAVMLTLVGLVGLIRGRRPAPSLKDAA